MAVAGMNPYGGMGIGNSMLMGMGMGMGIGMGMGMGQMGMPMMGMPMMGMPMMGMGMNPMMAEMSAMMQMEQLMLMGAEQQQMQKLMQQMTQMAQMQQQGGMYGQMGTFGQMGGYGNFQGGCGSNSAAVNIASSQLGKAAINVNMPHYSHAGGVTNNCADFVSACCANAGTFRKSPGDASVMQFRNNLLQQGWRPVPKDQARPGDVAIIVNGNSQHTELVATHGATKCIGSNGSSVQSISYDTPSNWASNVMYLAPPPKAGAA